MSTSIDLNRTSGLVSLGTHTFQVMDKSEEDVGDAGPYWRVICQVISAGDDQGKEVMHNISLGPKSRFIMDDFLDGIDAPRKGKWSLEQSIGKKFRASVSQESYNGKLKSTLETILPAADLQGSFDDLPSEVSEEDAALPDDVTGDEEPEKETKGRRKF